MVPYNIVRSRSPVAPMQCALVADEAIGREQLLDDATDPFRSLARGRGTGQILNSLLEHVAETDPAPIINILKPYWVRKKMKNEFQVANFRGFEQVPELT
ncbi:Hypothetical predicted protein [Lecanosticta acicola]|uniref:Uncharacterized protein n=1 Tax=Lecanosticta acicola TaxID=111012 RepID=A0AAI9EDD7_9PEZI|nr:Hypothetical predicted protein [Lecanosticta acicola]